MKQIKQRQQNKTEIPIQFLWSKWQHHDSLAYSRWASAMILEVATISGTVLGLKYLDQNGIVGNLILLILYAVVWFLASFTISVFIKCQQIDIYVRNTFNKSIVKHLLKTGELDEHLGDWKFSSYDASDNKHPINLWHTPSPFDKGRDTRATKWNKMLLIIFKYLNIIVSILFFVYFLCLLNQWLTIAST